MKKSFLNKVAKLNTSQNDAVSICFAIILVSLFMISIWANLTGQI